MKKTIGLLLLVTSGTFLSVNTATATQNTKLDRMSVGDYYQGGVIYWLDSKKSNKHGLIVDIKDAPDAAGYAWDTTPPSKTGATGNKPYAGKTNTQAIIAAIGANRAHAASACANSHNQDYSDWYLPAKKELELMLGKGRMTAEITKTAKAHGGAAFNHTPYWSSTEFHVNSAWNITGGSSTQAITYKKSIPLSVRCIRSFSVAAQSVPTIDVYKIKSTQLLTGPYSYFVPPYNYYYFHHMDKLDFKFDWVRRAGAVYPLKEPTGTFTTNYTYNKHTYTLDQYMQRNAVTGFLVLKDNQIIYERYFHGADQQSRFLTNSVGKSITSTLVGIALEEGKISSVNDPIIKYLPELKESGFNRVTIKQALLMASGLDLSYTPYDPHSSTHQFNKSALTGNPSFMNLLKSLKANMKIKPGTIFDYENENTEALGLALEKAVGKPLNEYMQEKIWSKIGAQSDAFLYRAKAQPDQCAFGCVSATVRDYGRFGLMMMNGGSLNGKQIVGASWVKEATTAGKFAKPVDESEGLGYGYQWWIPSGSDQAFKALGIFGQIISVNPAKHIVIVETSAWPKPEDNKKWNESAKLIDAIVEKL